MTDLFFRQPRIFYQRWLDMLNATAKETEAMQGETERHPFEQFLDSLFKVLGTLGPKPIEDETWDSVCDQLQQGMMSWYSQTAGKWGDLPIFGVARESRQKLVDATEAHHQLAMALSDFVARFGRPLRQTVSELVTQLADGRQATDDPQAVFSEFMRRLDQCYDGYLKSPQGVKSVSSFIDAYLAYREKQSAAQDVWLKAMDLPGRRDMQAVYRQLYTLKKRVHGQKQQLEAQTQTIDRLEQRIAQIESAME